jgi:hypothetical protein
MAGQSQTLLVRYTVYPSVIAHLHVSFRWYSPDAECRYGGVPPACSSLGFTHKPHGDAWEQVIGAPRLASPPEPPTQSPSARSCLNTTAHHPRAKEYTLNTTKPQVQGRTPLESRSGSARHVGGYGARERV